MYIILHKALGLYFCIEFRLILLSLLEERIYEKVFGHIVCSSINDIEWMF